MLPTLSLEQKQVIDELQYNNVIVDSVAGSGKTTCSLFIAKNFHNLKILQLTYNKRLKLETREKVIKNDIKNLEVHSYHSFCVKNYDRTCFKDENINSILKLKKPPLNEINFDLLIIDEAQDMTPLYYELFCKIFKDNKQNSKICIFGDIKQSIFDFNNADERFIIFADKLFVFNNIPWKKCKFSQSFRITNNMASFVNNCLLNDNRIISLKRSDNKPRYLRCNCFKTENLRPFDEVKYYLNLGYLPEDIFIIAPSVKNENSPIRLLENKIKRELNVPVYVPISEEEKLDDEILEGKLCFSTFHQVKGLERKVIIIFGFDNSFFQFFKKEKNPYICPNELYVASTRGLEHLTFLHHYQNDFLPFIDKNNLELYCDVEYYENINVSENNNKRKNIKTSVTDLIRHIPQIVLNECFSFLEINNLLKKKDIIDISLKTYQDSGCESVSEITGIAIPSFFELKIKGKMNIFDKLIEEPIDSINTEINTCTCDISDFEDFEEIDTKYYNLNDIDLNKLSPEELLYISNTWNTYKTGFLYKQYQINKFDWLSEKNLLKAIDRMKHSLNISTNAVFEALCENELINRKLIGYIDCIDDNNIYEFKCVQQIETEHFLQLAIYMYQIEKINKNKNYNYYLYNILTDELFQVKCTLNNLIKIVEILIKHKYFNKEKIDDNTFLKNNLIIKNKYK
jgi:hypothetical protein